MKPRYLQLSSVLFFALSAASAGAAEATIGVTEPLQPRQDLIDSRDTIRNAESDRMLKQLQQERQKLAQLKRTLTDRHPEVMMTSKRIADLEARLREQGVLTTPPEGLQKAPTK
jgi:uncharacterized protein involved in exopolysaccharide biosynthesis